MDYIMSFIFDTLLDDLWLPVPTGYKKEATRVAFTLAFITVLSTDDQCTLASKRRVRCISK
jgi:hypothetical protein